MSKSKKDKNSGSAPVAAEAAVKPLIYLAEPSKILAKMITSALAEKGFEVELFEDGYTLLKKVIVQSPNLIISDNNLAKIDGTEGFV